MNKLKYIILIMALITAFCACENRQTPGKDPAATENITETQTSTEPQDDTVPDFEGLESANLSINKILKLSDPLAQAKKYGTVSFIVNQYHTADTDSRTEKVCFSYYSDYDYTICYTDGNLSSCRTNYYYYTNIDGEESIEALENETPDETDNAMKTSWFPESDVLSEVGKYTDTDGNTCYVVKSRANDTPGFSDLWDAEGKYFYYVTKLDKKSRCKKFEIYDKNHRLSQITYNYGNTYKDIAKIIKRAEKYFAMNADEESVTENLEDLGPTP